jgi:hypothetical protein
VDRNTGDSFELHLLRRRDLPNRAEDNKESRLRRPSKAHRRQFCETPGYDGCPRFVEYVTYLKEEVEEQRS